MSRLVIGLLGIACLPTPALAGDCPSADDFVAALSSVMPNVEAVPLPEAPPLADTHDDGVVVYVGDPVFGLLVMFDQDCALEAEMKLVTFEAMALAAENATPAP